MTMSISIPYRRPGLRAMAIAAAWSALQRAAEVAGSGLRCYRAWREHQLALRALRQMDNHLLRDIGIGRSDIMAAVYGVDGGLKRRNLHE